MQSTRAIVLCGTLALVGLAVVLSQRSPAQQATGAEDQADVTGGQGAQGQQGSVGQVGVGAAGGEQQDVRSGAATRVGGTGGTSLGGGGSAGTFGFQDFQNQPSVRGRRGFQGTFPRGQQQSGLPFSQAYYGMMSSAADPLQSEDAQLEQQSHELANQYAKAADGEARQKLRGELAEAIAKHFDVRHQIRERELREIEARVNRLRDALERRQNAREEIIQRRLAQLLSDAQGVGF